jgi:hypothetical protein
MARLFKFGARCSLIDGKDKLLVTKLDSLWKHASCCKVLVVMPKVKVGEH